MLSATTRPWYLATWVNSATPVTSPTAHTPATARQCLSTGDGTAAIRPDPGSFQAEPGGGGTASGAQDHHIGLHVGAVVEGEDGAAADWPGADRGAPGVDGDALSRERLPRQIADPGVLPVDQGSAALDDSDLGAHPGVEQAEFGADRAAAD